MTTPEKGEQEGKMRIEKNGTKWTVRWIQEGTPRRYWAASWGEAAAFARAQRRVMDEDGGAVYVREA